MTNYNELMGQLQNYKETVKGLENQHNDISQEISVLQNSKMALLMQARFEDAEKLDVKIEALTRRQGSINSLLLATPQRTAREFYAMSQDVRASLLEELKLAQADYDAQAAKVLKAKDAYIVQLLELTKVRGIAGKLNEQYATVQVEIEGLRPMDEVRNKISFTGIGQIQERKMFPDNWTNTPEDEMIGISQEFQRRVYPQIG